MADPENSAAQNAEEDFAIPGQDDDNPMAGVDLSGGAPSGQPQAPTAPTSPQPAPADATQGPKVSGRAMFLGNLLKTILSGVQNAPGNPNNAFDRGFMGASPQAQAKQKADAQLQNAAVSKALSEADQAKLQTSITSMKALQLEYLIKRLPMDQQEAHMKTVTAAADFLIKEGASIEAEGDEKAADAQAFHLNGTDERAMNHTGRFYSLPSGKMDDKGMPKYDVVFVATKDVLQNDWTSPDGSITLKAGTPMGASLGKVVDELTKGAQADHKADHAAMANALKPNVPDGELNQTIEWLKSQKQQNTPLYQQNKNAVDAQVNVLSNAQRTTQHQKIQQAEAMSGVKQAAKDEAGQKAGKDALAYAKSYIDSGDYTGSGDEALLEKFFELAKPSTGFRMSQPQIDMLKNSRSWVESAKAKAGYIEGGKLFSDSQRKQIVDTMQRLQTAKGGAATTAPKRPPNVPGNAVWNPESKQWRLPQ